MSYWTRKTSHISDPAVIAFPDGVSTPYSITLADTGIPADLEGNKTFPAGMFIANAGGVDRLLPRATVTTNAIVASTTTALTLSPYMVFKTGDVIRVVEPYATVTLSGSIANTETVTVTINGVAIVYTASGSPTLAAAATAITALINTDSRTKGIVNAIADGAVIYIFAKNGISNYTLTAADTAASGTATASSATLLSNVSVGTVAATTVVQTSGNIGTVTLASAASVSLPVGAHIGVLVDEIYGVYPHSVDMSDKAAVDIAPVAAAHGVYKAALPYHDFDIERRLPELRIKESF